MLFLVRVPSAIRRLALSGRARCSIVVLVVVLTRCIRLHRPGSEIGQNRLDEGTVAQELLFYRYLDCLATPIVSRGRFSRERLRMRSQVEWEDDWSAFVRRL